TCFYYFSSYCDHRDLHSFPTRRSSDLREDRRLDALGAVRVRRHLAPVLVCLLDQRPHLLQRVLLAADAVAFREHAAGRAELDDRSEEHTSELQSRENLVCRLLLEKKNK